jgi:hypothetical protein
MGRWYDVRAVVRPAMVFFPPNTARHSSVCYTQETEETFSTLIVGITVAYAKSKRVSIGRRAFFWVCKERTKRFDGRSQRKSRLVRRFGTRGWFRRF